MIIYLVKMIHKPSQKVCYKIGHTQKKIAERFSSEEYNDFDITRLSHIFFSHDKWAYAKVAAETLEFAIQQVIPPKSPSFIIEDYFNVPRDTLKIGGVTELIFLKENQTEQLIVDRFNVFVDSVDKLQRKLNRIT